jgi:hypothetical protein
MNTAKTDLSIKPSTPTNTPYIILIDSTQRPSGAWRYAVTNPDGAVMRAGGDMQGVDGDVLTLYALAAHSAPFHMGLQSMSAPRVQQWHKWERG